MKIVIVVGAGLADEPVGDLDGKTPLDRARTPHLDHIASRGIFGLTRTISRGAPVDRDGGLLAVLGYAPAEQVGAGVLEAVGLGVPLGADDVALPLRPRRARDVGRGTARCSAIRSPGSADAEIGRTLATDLAPGLASGGLTLHPGARPPPRARLARGRRRGPDDGALRDGREADRPLPAAGAAGGESCGRSIESSQALLAEHPVCRAFREQGGAAPSAFWPWGAGRRPSLQPLARLGLVGAIVAVRPARDRRRAAGRPRPWCPRRRTEAEAGPARARAARPRGHPRRVAQHRGAARRRAPEDRGHRAARRGDRRPGARGPPPARRRRGVSS